MESLFGLVVAVTPTARGEWKVGKFSKEKEEKSVGGASSLAGLKIEQARKNSSDVAGQKCFCKLVLTSACGRTLACVFLHTCESAAWVIKVFLFLHTREKRRKCGNWDQAGISKLLRSFRSSIGIKVRFYSHS